MRTCPPCPQQCRTHKTPSHFLDRTHDVPWDRRHPAGDLVLRKTRCRDAGGYLFSTENRSLTVAALMLASKGRTNRAATVRERFRPPNKYAGTPNVRLPDESTERDTDVAKAG